MKLSEQLKLIADGIYPVTGELIKKESVAHTPEAVRLGKLWTQRMPSLEKLCAETV